MNLVLCIILDRNDFSIVHAGVTFGKHIGIMIARLIYIGIEHDHAVELHLLASRICISSQDFRYIDVFKRSNLHAIKGYMH